ncbi:MAG: ATP-binding cassette domain-containing protein [Pseudomonadota bacterium]|nr:ATP-binding cassette domain-containing protein [Pseudomonadota bacterium]MEC7549709.1 ATP-binding cassette domain-containing protein [Pseudomonadota bacterium]MEC7996571.1 ATP-binding cassette domain-containing protein [Pseudomonadota bacterium]MEC8431054.1 ATP-binding cassette domain-containing protein [Pseudomonadota bacterium]MEE3087597.1 ATP-binding cassette domain-containing protein [Pseudomonadota bacterium]
MSVVLECLDLGKTYTEGPQSLEVLRQISLRVKQGEQLAILGTSGSGKTTLLNLLGGLDLPSRGRVIVAGQDLAEVDETERGRLRNLYLGFVYQFHHLLSEFTALENISMPLLIAGYSRKEALQKSQIMLERVGLLDRASHKPSELSGGERQRIAIARALVTEPACVLLDEPTGNLDRNTALNIQDLMSDLNEKLDISYIVVTHDEAFADTLDRKLFLRDGMLHA